MENCRKDAAVITFNDDNDPSDNKIKTEDKNYCVREDEGLSRFLRHNLFCGISVQTVGELAITAVAIILGDGAGAMWVLGTLIAISEAYANIKGDIDMIWPGAR